jgi:hypothetical protein
VKIVASEGVEFKATKSNSWFRKMAEEAELEVDDNMLDGGQADGDLLERQRLKEAKNAKKELAGLLAAPMKKQHFTKFLSSVGARAEIAVQGDVNQRVVKPSKNSTKVKKTKKKEGGDEEGGPKTKKRKKETTVK